MHSPTNVCKHMKIKHTHTHTHTHQFHALVRYIHIADNLGRCAFDRLQVPYGSTQRVMSVRQTVHPIIQYKPLIVKSTQAEVIYLYRVDDVICRPKRTKFAPCVFVGVSQNLQKVVVSYVFFHIIFLNAFCLFL